MPSPPLLPFARQQKRASIPVGSLLWASTRPKKNSQVAYHVYRKGSTIT